MSNAPQLTIAVCTYRRFDLLAKCLNSLNNQTLPAKEFKVLIIDNSLQEEQSNIFKNSLNLNFNFEYIITKKNGIAYARNVAINNCTSKYLAYIDDDVLATPHWAKSMLDAFARHKTAGVIGGKVSPIWEIDKPSWITHDMEINYAALDWGEEQKISHYSKKWLVSASIGYRMDAIKRTSGFDENLGRIGSLAFAHEEFALNLNIEQLGYDIVFSPEIEVSHLVHKERLTKKWFCSGIYLNYISLCVFNNALDVSISQESIISFFYNQLDKHIANVDFCDNNTDISNINNSFYMLAQKDARAFGLDITRPYPLKNNCIYIVTPCYNAKETVLRTILSVFMQTGNFTIRYHVQDGGSTDGTLDILAWADEFCRQQGHLFPNKGVIFSYDYAPDNGIYDAVNKGFSRTTRQPNSAMTWINADDFLVPTACADALKAFAIDGISWVCGKIFVHSKDQGSVHYTRVIFPQKTLQLGLCDGIHWNFVQQEGTFWKSHVWEEYNGLNVDLKRCADWDLWRRFSQKYELYTLPFATASFMQREGQLSAFIDSYYQEINGIIPCEVRDKAMRAIAKRYYTLQHPCLENISGKLYRTKKTCSEENMPHCAFNWIKVRRKPQQEHQFNKENICNKNEDIHNNNLLATLFALPILHRLYLKSPSFIQQTLTFIKYNLILYIFNYYPSISAYIKLRKSGLFFNEYYLCTNQDVKNSKMNPLWHYIRQGSQEGRKPNPFFDPNWYLAQNSDVGKAKHEPLLHYILHGWKEEREVSPEVSMHDYLIKRPDVKKANVNPLLHYLKYGLIEMETFNNK